MRGGKISLRYFYPIMWDSSTTDFKSNLAVFIGINNYQNGIHPLKTAVNDAAALADLLETKYNYQVMRLFPHKDNQNEATLENINKLFSETLPQTIQSPEVCRLLFYFAGHGIARNGENGPAGYLVPQNIIPFSKILKQNLRNKVVKLVKIISGTQALVQKSYMSRQCKG